MSPSQIVNNLPGKCFHTLRGGVDPGELRLLSHLIGVVYIWKVYDQGMGPYCPRVGRDYDFFRLYTKSARSGSMDPSQIQINPWGWGFDTLGGDIDPGGVRFQPRFIGDADIWKYLSSGDGTLSFPGATGSISLSQSVTSRWRLGVHTVRGGVDSGDRRIFPLSVGVVVLWRDLCRGDGSLSPPDVVERRCGYIHHQSSRKNSRLLHGLGQSMSWRDRNSTL